MSDRRYELFLNVARLRRASLQLPDNDDLRAVRAALEAELGPTISRRLAARILGVSHTALDRWIRSQEIPVVFAETGRLDIPVSAVLEIYEASRDRRPDERYLLMNAMERQQNNARGLRSATDNMSGDGHERAATRGRAYHDAIAQRLRKAMVIEARHTLHRWRADGRINDQYADKWEQVLSGTVPEVRRAITERTAEADDMRQNSPFAGALSEPERRKIMDGRP